MIDDQAAKTTMHLLGQFMKKNQMIRLTKMGVVSDHKHLQPIDVGTKIEGTLSYFPKEGESFNLDSATVKGDGSNYTDKHYSWWSTSVIIEFLPDNQFRTKNSIYKYELL